MTDFGGTLSWWLEEESEQLAAAVCRAAAKVEQDTSYRYQRMLEVSCLYGEISAYNTTGNWIRQIGGARRQITHNIIANAVDALVSEVTQTSPRPMAVTVGGDWYDRQKARKLTSYWDAKWQDVGMRALGPQVLRDGVLFGDGWLRPCVENGLVKVERIWPGHIRVDDRACIDVMPRTLYIARPIDRNRLVGIYPEYEDEIRGAPAPSPRWDYTDPTRDVVEVVEAWHLPSADPNEDDEHDGRHVVAIATALLVDEPWTRQEFPLAHFRAVMPQRGWLGESLAWRAAPYQFELNKIARRIQEAMHIMAVPRVFLQRQSGVVKAKLNNEVGTIVEYDGTPPQFLTPPAMSSEVYQYRRDLEQGVFAVMGISQLSAQSLKPSGLNSGKAIRLYNDIQSRRFINTERAYEDLHVQLAKEIARLERQIEEDKPRHTVRFARGKNTDTVKWREIDFDDDRIIIQVFPASALPTTPAAKLQALEEMLEAGTIDQQTFYELADVPDLESARLRITAPSELIQKRLDRILETGEYLGPEPYMDLARAMQMSAMAVQRAELEDAPEERLELLRDFMTDCQALIERSQQPPPAPPPPPDVPTGAPPAAPMGPAGGAAPPMAPETAPPMAAMN